MAETEPTAAARRTDRRERPGLVPDRECMVVCSIVAAMVCCREQVYHTGAAMAANGISDARRSSGS